MNNILFEIIINSNCNKRCTYCDLDFKDKEFSTGDIDKFITFLRSNIDSVNYYHINFFGGEPLLSFDKIEYFVENAELGNLKYSIGTNGLLLDKSKLDFFKKHDFTLSLSIDNISGAKTLQNLDLAGYENIIEINFINDPDFMIKSEETFEQIKKYTFKQINIMPVFTTKKWGGDSLKNLYNLKSHIDKSLTPNIRFYSYFNGLSADIQFVLDTDLNFYRDLDSILWLQKQYKILPAELRENIDKKTRVCSLADDDCSIDKLLSGYDKKDILKTVLGIPVAIGTAKENMIIDKILKNGA